MFKKYSILVWVVLLLILVGIYIAVEYTSSANRTFRPKVASFIADDITSMRIINKPDGTTTELKKVGEALDIYEHGKVFSGEPKAWANALELLNNMNTDSIVATRKDQWAEYKVDDEKAIIIELYTGDDLIETVYVGKFEFKQIPSQNPQEQAQTKMTSYVRTEDDVMVFAIDGILRINFQDGRRSFRSKAVFRCNDPSGISKVTITSMYDELVLDMSTAEWKLNGAVVDSMKTVRYLQRLARMNNSGYIDDVNLESMTPAYTMQIEGSTFAPVTLKAYPADSTIGHYVTSSMNPGTVFDGSKSRLFEKVFVGKEKFLGN